MPISTERQLLTNIWSADVDAIEHVLKGMVPPFPAENSKVIFAEVVEDGLLHVTVAREHESFTITPWSGPEKAADGFRYVHAFGDKQVNDIAQSIRDQLGTTRLDDRKH